MNPKILEINRALDPYKHQIIHHPIYKNIHSLEGIKAFSQVHVFAVWDFMSLLKSLQNGLTCVTLPWKPIGDAEIRYLINEIVLGEESDVDLEGNRISHFELYLKAMNEMGANTQPIENLIKQTDSDLSIFDSIQQQPLHPNIKNFLEFTFDIAINAPLHVKAAVFTFGREDLIPNMFIEILNSIELTHKESIKTFKYYIERHIEVDGDHHSILALKMVDMLCGNDSQKWKDVETASIQSLKMRKGLWDSLL